MKTSNKTQISYSTTVRVLRSQLQQKLIEDKNFKTIKDRKNMKKIMELNGFAFYLCIWWQFFIHWDKAVF